MSASIFKQGKESKIGVPYKILDEPFKGLDEALQQTVIDIIKEESAKRDFIIVTHESFDGEFEDGKILYL